MYVQRDLEGMGRKKNIYGEGGEEQGRGEGKERKGEGVGQSFIFIYYQVEISEKIVMFYNMYYNLKLWYFFLDLKMDQMSKEDSMLIF